MKVTERVERKSSHHKKKRFFCNHVCWQMVTRLILVIILQYAQISNHYVAYLNYKMGWKAKSFHRIKDKEQGREKQKKISDWLGSHSQSCLE